MFLKEKNFSMEAYSLDHMMPCFGYRFIEHDKRKIHVEFLKKYGIKEGPILKQLQMGKDINYLGKKIKVKDATSLKKGGKVGIILDTALNKNCYKIAKDVDLLICESTFLNDKKDKAKAFRHLTASDAASIAKNQGR